MLKKFKVILSPNHNFFVGLKEYFLDYQKQSSNNNLVQYNLIANIDKIINSIIYSIAEEVKYDDPKIDLNSEIPIIIYDDSNLCFDHNIGKALKGQDIGDLLFELTNIFYSYINEEAIQKKYLAK